MPPYPFTICIVIPCYNEEKGLAISKYISFLDTNPDVMICFVNDGSKDNTLKILKDLQENYPKQIQVYSLEKNSGKAEAVRVGIQYCNNHLQHDYIGYLDADLATSLEEFITLKNYIQNEIVFCFGSRIRIIGSQIDRKNARFIIGRIIATFISKILNLKIYDTQCGSKLFTKAIAEQLFQKRFISRWLFDVEIFYRLILLFGREKAITKMLEIPLKLWVEKGDSKIKLSYGFQVWIDLFQIKRQYKKLEKDIVHRKKND
jgi:dolichyl-phosphate beta-glucosyltransferase